MADDVKRYAIDWTAGTVVEADHGPLVYYDDVAAEIKRLRDALDHATPSVRTGDRAPMECRTCHKPVDVAFWCDDGYYECLPCRYPQAVSALRADVEAAVRAGIDGGGV